MLNFQFSNGSHEETEIKNKNEVICDLLETARQDEIPDGKIRDKETLAQLVQPLYVDQGTDEVRSPSRYYIEKVSTRRSVSDCCKALFFYFLVWRKV